MDKIQPTLRSLRKKKKNYTPKFWPIFTQIMPNTNYPKN